jgi:acyl CoA:acetate/3-ketoacid CoA transferase
MIDGPSQFDFYSGGGLGRYLSRLRRDRRYRQRQCLKLGGVTVGPGGFIDIAQNAKKVVFCGTFDAKGTDLEIGAGRLTVKRNGEVGKLVRQVEQITYSGRVALERSQEVVYVTERAVFRLTDRGVTLIEVAPGVDVKKDVLARMQFERTFPRAGNHGCRTASRRKREIWREVRIAVIGRA